MVVHWWFVPSAPMGSCLGTPCLIHPPPPPPHFLPLLLLISCPLSDSLLLLLLLLLQAKKQPPLKRRQLTVYQAIVTKTDNTGRLLSKLFMKRPSPKVYPEYYLVIPKPIDLREIRLNIRAQKYSTLGELMGDVELMCSNACTFNEEGSQVYNVCTV